MDVPSVEAPQNLICQCVSIDRDSINRHCSKHGGAHHTKRRNSLGSHQSRSSRNEKTTCDSDLEETEEEDDSEDDSEEEEENDSDAEVDSSHNESKTSLNDTKNSLNESKKSLNESIHNRSHKQVSVADLLASPSIDLFNALGSNCAQVILDEINSEPEDRYLESMLLAIMKVSSLVPSTTLLQSPSNSVFECTKALYRALFSWASSGSDKLSTVTNTLLVHLGLIKSEDKSFKITYNVLGCLTAVRLLSEAKLLPPQTEEQLWACIKLNDKKKAKGDIALVECY
uniref:Ran-GTPase activating protein 1 C-terminal domain-containing protein n=1 Tax=Cacopsylla melanoneura TaxID=428564 RepID=A0A8D9FCQ5_9HEMI